MYKYIPNAAIECQAEDFYELVKKSHIALFENPPDQLHLSESTDGIVKLLLMSNTQLYKIEMEREAYDNLLSAILQGATLEEICMMLNLPK